MRNNESSFVLSNQMEDSYIKLSSVMSIHDSDLFKDCVVWAEKALLLIARHFCYSCIALGSLFVKIKWRKKKKKDGGTYYVAFSHLFFDGQDSLALSSC